MHFDPAHVNHMQAFASGFGELGYQVSLLVHSDYKRFEDSLLKHGHVVYYEHSNQYEGVLKDARLVFIANPAVANVQLAWWCSRHGVATAYLYHEPWRGLRYYWRKGVRAQVWALGLRVVTLAFLPRISTVVLASHAALAEYERRTRRYNANTALIPLLFTDIYAGKEEPNSGNRRYVSFIGKAAPEHQLAAFIEYVESTIGTRAGEGLEYLIATPSQLGTRMMKRLTTLTSSGKVTLQCGRVLSIEEINDYYRRSIAVWNVYAESMQSGVMAQAFMHGTPVIASRVGSFTEFVIPGVNGELVDSPDPALVSKAVQRIRGQLDTYVDGARRSFLTTFFYRAHLESLRKLLPTM